MLSCSGLVQELSAAFVQLSTLLWVADMQKEEAGCYRIEILDFKALELLIVMNQNTSQHWDQNSPPTLKRAFAFLS